ncbi:sulfite exporter TauE/SafE family protein [Antarcticirhabdus aurantiaca]|uniref:Sulfite exporter TauE/SafE family protein n=1 Tax=Antarcticirhabdus aurantiaca TaxID=2606717 RepID=A0ACD4NLE8_9HYPH|nr:sulfite exporter TauE/SafE family protein [Antarcticirhabdus aurantiaca]WAJ27717.1 sulfite exporter TauE/SafE family protein [Jeongeuplla avenae]
MDDFLLFLLVGALAQLVDGALGMAYGVISSTVLLSFGVAPATASASVHAAELFTTAASGTAHLANRNIDWNLFWRLAPFGIIGGVLGTYVLTGFPADSIRPFVAAYLGIIGVYLLFRSFRRVPSQPVKPGVVPPLAVAGGFLDSVGGGGWGPIVTTGLLGFGGQPRYVIGTVNAAEFLITLSVSLTFLFALLTGHWEEAGDLTSHGLAVLGLIVGGLIAAPFAGIIVRRLPETTLLRIVGGLICILSITQIVGLLRG